MHKHLPATQHLPEFSGSEATKNSINKTVKTGTDEWVSGDRWTNNAVHSVHSSDTTECTIATVHRRWS